jgi:hypothetical protein
LHYSGQLDFTAAPGEANRVTISYAPGLWTVTDAGAPLEAVDPCPRPSDPYAPYACAEYQWDRCEVSSDRHTVTCAKDWADGAVVELGDGDDVAVVNVPFVEPRPPEAPQILGGTRVRILGGDGADRLVGGIQTDDFLDGGPGADSFEAGGGYENRVSYGGRTAPVAVSLDGVANDGEPGEGDNIPDNVRVEGGAGADRIDGDEGANALNGGMGDDVINGGGGSDFIGETTGNDTIDVRDPQGSAFGAPRTDQPPWLSSSALAPPGAVSPGPPGGWPWDDSVLCGPGHDIVLADPWDADTSGECEEMRTDPAVQPKVARRLGATSVPVTCLDAQACGGSVRIVKGGRTLAKGRFQMPARSVGRVRLKLSKLARSRLKAGRRLPVRLQVNRAGLTAEYRTTLARPGR